jgi:signal transduction histidine kinase
LARKAGDVLTESGAPLADLALLFALRNGGSAAMGVVVSRVREHPSFLTAELLDAAPGLGDLKAEWAAQETTRTLLRDLLRQHPDCSAPGPREDVGSAQADVPPFLAWVSPQRDGCHVSLLPATDVQSAFGAIADVPHGNHGYDAVEVSGKHWSLTLGGRSARILLASATASLAIESGYAFSVKLYATPESLYAGYRRRLWLTAALILSAALTAFLGLASLWRGFQRQARLSEMKSSFVSSVSHELRAPIAAVRLMAESLEQGRISGEVKQKEYFRLIVQECRRLSTLVENVLDFSRIDRGRKRYTFERVDLIALVRHTVALMQPCAAEGKVDLILEDLPAEAAGLEPSWDHQAVEQSLVNLLDNAIKHSPPGAEVKVRIESAAGRVRVWVEDRGPGIPPEAQARIFDLFYRHGSELRRETKGAGIGLSIVKHVAEAHGGRVVVESVVGQGSRFALELPVGGGAK